MSVYPAFKRVPGAELPRWERGYPSNLTAAATDALEWLRHFQGLPLRREHIRPLARAIQELERFTGAIYCPEGAPPPAGSIPIGDNPETEEKP